MSVKPNPPTGRHCSGSKISETMSSIMVQMKRAPVRHEQAPAPDGPAIAAPAPGDGPPLVVCPGSLATARDWQPVARALGSRLTTYAVDRRGHGRSGGDPASGLGPEGDE